ncbi:DJ-1 PROTEIN [Salix koriyanagi]|uniref:DJ-1 PROTEIN n=1 Tax=Salix koriyanagi TaxID=2511006 RepID=A0A9Q0WST3_9ROSI|nr:DJ-1 PROTEIN [Salix koriyanagi]
MQQKFKILYYSILFLDILHRLMDAGAHWVEPEAVKACLADGNTGASHRRGPSSVHPDKKILFLRGDFIEDYEVTVPFQSPEALECHVEDEGRGNLPNCSPRFRGRSNLQ